MRSPPARSLAQHTHWLNWNLYGFSESVASYPFSCPFDAYSAPILDEALCCVRETCGRTGLLQHFRGSYRDFLFSPRRPPGPEGASDPAGVRDGGAQCLVGLHGVQPWGLGRGGKKLWAGAGALLLRLPKRRLLGSARSGRVVQFGSPGQIGAPGGELPLRVQSARGQSFAGRARPLEVMASAPLPGAHLLPQLPVPFWVRTGAGDASLPHKSKLEWALWAPLRALPAARPLSRESGGEEGGVQQPGSASSESGCTYRARSPRTRPGGAGPSPGEATSRALGLVQAPWQPSPFFWEGGGLGDQISSAETNKGRCGPGPAPVCRSLCRNGLPRKPGSPFRAAPALLRQPAPGHPYPLSAALKSQKIGGLGFSAHPSPQQNCSSV